MVTDYRGHRQTLLPVREINLKACTPVIVKQFFLPVVLLTKSPAQAILLLGIGWTLGNSGKVSRFNQSINQSINQPRSLHWTISYTYKKRN